MQGEVCGLGRGLDLALATEACHTSPPGQPPEHSPPQVSLHLRQLPLQRQHLQGQSAVGPPITLPAPPELCSASSVPCYPLQLNPPLTQGKGQIRSQRTFSLHAARRRPCPQQHVCEAQKQASDHGCLHDDTVMSPGPLPHDSGRAVPQHTWTIMDVTMLSKALRRETAIRAAPPGTQDEDSPSAVTYFSAARPVSRHPGRGRLSLCLSRSPAGAESPGRGRGVAAVP